MFRFLDDFDNAVRAGFHPLSKLDDETLTQIRDSLIFGDGRLQEIDHRVARGALSPHDYIDLMHELGVRYDDDDPRFAGIEPPHPSAPQTTAPFTGHRCSGRHHHHR